MHSYFGQVGCSGSSSSPVQGQPSGTLETPESDCETLTPVPFHQRLSTTDGLLQPDVPSSIDELVSTSGKDGEISPQLHEQAELTPSSSAQPRGLHPYPTPPVSKRPSLQKAELSEPTSEGDGSQSGKSSTISSILSFALRKSTSDLFPSKSLTASVLNPLSSIVTVSNVYAAHFSSPADRSPTRPSTPNQACFTSSFSSDSISYDRLKKLTDDAGPPREKSNPPTPTRALSNQTASSDASGGSDHVNGNGKTSAPSVDVAAANASHGLSGAPVKVARGKLTVKIAEARGLRRSKDPYVVAVFQRNELVSKGPRSEDDEDDEDAKIPMGGIPISRQGSDSGRPMAIPMKSRQSSNTSLTDHRDFKMKARKLMTNPKWDTEAAL
jgi:protein-serine/threonine kinase